MASRSWLVAVAVLVAGGIAAVATGVIDPSVLMSTEPTPVTHTVVRGDTLSKLAQAHGATVTELQQWNGLKSDRIDVGQVLVVGWSQGSAPAIGTTDPPDKRARKRSNRKRAPTSSSGKPSSGKPSSSTELRLPPKQACLAAPSIDGIGDEPDFAASAGLSYSQTKQAMDAFLPQIQRCIEGEFPQGRVELSITVACSGRVDRTTVTDAGGLSAELTRCITDTLRYAPFPAHDLPDGETFTYPMTFSR